MATRTASSSATPTNKEVFDKLVQSLLLVILNVLDIRGASSRYIHLLPNIMKPTSSPHPFSLFDYTFTELVFSSSNTVNITSVFVLFVIIGELNFNWNDEARRPINIRYMTWIDSIFFGTIVLFFVRFITTRSEDEMFVRMLVGSVVLTLVAVVGWLVKRRSMK